MLPNFASSTESSGSITLRARNRCHSLINSIPFNLRPNRLLPASFLFRNPEPFVTITNYLIIHRPRRRKPAELLPRRGHELALLTPRVRILRQPLDLVHVEFLLFEAAEHALCVVGGDVVQLGEVFFLFNFFFRTGGQRSFPRLHVDIRRDHHPRLRYIGA